MTKDEALRLALEALRTWAAMQPNTTACAIRIPAIAAIKEALAQPDQEPECPECKAVLLYECVACSNNNYPPQREWVGLTDDEISKVLGADIHAEQSGELRFIRAIEAKLKEKNNG